MYTVYCIPLKKELDLVEGLTSMLAAVSLQIPPHSFCCTKM